MKRRLSGGESHQNQWLLLWKHLVTPKPQMSPVWIKTTYARTTPDPLMKPNVIGGIGRCCTRGFVGVEVVGTVGQWADSGAWDYFVKHTLTHRVKNGALSASATALTANDLGYIRLQLCKWKRQKEGGLFVVAKMHPIIHHSKSWERQS